MLKIINYISAISIPLIIVIIVGLGIKEKKNVYDLFIEGVKEGIQIIVKIFPTLLGIFIAVGMFRNSGAFEYISKIIENKIGLQIFPTEILPLAIMKPISGSASLALGAEIMRNSGVDSKIGRIAATIMGSTETTLYVIAVYTSFLKIKKTREILTISLLADFVGIITAIFICNALF